ncbi:MAG: hypothetical protein AAF598_06460 [Bacteroidota bacterium]
MRAGKGAISWSVLIQGKLINGPLLLSSERIGLLMAIMAQNWFDCWTDMPSILSGNIYFGNKAEGLEYWTVSRRIEVEDFES